MKNLWMFAVSLVLLWGCGPTEPPQFRLDMVRIKKNNVPPERQREIANILTALFGTPDLKRVKKIDAGKSNVGQSDVIDEGTEIKGYLAAMGLDAQKVKLSAGPTVSDQEGHTGGLFRRHCVHCHGVTGDGKGPTAAFLNPYPRDYRLGIYKFYSTGKGGRPTNEDLRRVVSEGIPGTAMPAFKVALSPREIDALVEYVKYLSLRGEVEQELIKRAAAEPENPLPTDRDTLLGKSPAEGQPLAGGIVSDIVERWRESKPIMPPAKPELTGEALEKSLVRGRELFYNTTGNCFSCHGDTALGDGRSDLFDVWNTDVTEADVANGALPQQPLRSRNLRLGVYRGGHRPIDLFRRIKGGIDDASKMPGVGLPDEDIWHLVNYVQSLPYEPISQPSQRQLENVRAP